MKSKFTVLITALVLTISGWSFMFISSNGIAGYTGSPGEANCSNCHNGGSSSSSAITISSTPSFSNNEYVPGATYNLEITIAAAGFGRFGFGCEILNSLNSNAGVMQNAGAGVKFLNTVSGRRNAVQTTTKINPGSAVFAFEWVAPQSGPATIYASGNAVNGNGGTSGDFPLTPISLALQAQAPVDPVGITESSTLLGDMNVYPVPSNGITHLSFNLKQSSKIEISICDLTGKELKHVNEGEQQQGHHSKLLSLEGLSSGVYFVKLSAEGKKLSQKLLIVN
jgi:hypothetical protein